MKRIFKKHISETFCLGVLLISSLPKIALAASVTFANPVGWNSLEDITTSFLNHMQTMIAILAVVFIVIGGIIYMTAGGDEKRVEAAKKTITGAIIGLALAIGAPTLINEIYEILNMHQIGGFPTLLQIITNTLDLLLAIVGILAIISLVIGGVMYMTSGGDESRVEKGKSIVMYSIIGIAVALSGLVIVRAISWIIAGV